MAACGTVCSGAHDLPTLTDPAVGSTGDMLFFLGFCLSIVVIFSLSIAVSNLQDKVKKTAQEIAIIRKDMYDTYQKLEAEIKEEK